MFNLLFIPTSGSNEVCMLEVTTCHIHNEPHGLSRAPPYQTQQSLPGIEIIMNYKLYILLLCPTVETAYTREWP